MCSNSSFHSFTSNSIQWLIHQCSRVCSISVIYYSCVVIRLSDHIDINFVQGRETESKSFSSFFFLPFFPPLLRDDSLMVTFTCALLPHNSFWFFHQHSAIPSDFCSSCLLSIPSVLFVCECVHFFCLCIFHERRIFITFCHSLFHLITFIIIISMTFHFVFLIRPPKTHSLDSRCCCCWVRAPRHPL